MSPGSANFSPVDRFAQQQQQTSFESYVSAQSPTDFQPESRSFGDRARSFGDGLGIGLENLSPTNAPSTTYLQNHQDCYSPSEMYSQTQAQGRSPLNVYSPTSPSAHLGLQSPACTSPAAPSCTSPLFTEVVKLMAHGDLEQQLRAHENVPYED